MDNERLVQAELKDMINDMVPAEYCDDDNEEIDQLLSLYCVDL